MLPNYERFLAYDLACRGFYEIFRKKKSKKNWTWIIVAAYIGKKTKKKRQHVGSANQVVIIL